MTRPFLKMTAHEAMEAPISNIMTACTMALASSTRVQIDKSLPIAPLHKYILWNRPRLQRAGIETGDASARVDELHAAAHDGLPEADCGTAEALEFRGDENFIIEHGGTQEIHGYGHHRKLQPPLAAQAQLIDAEGAQPVGPAALHELEIICVIHHPARVGVLPVDPARNFELPGHL